MRIRHVTRNWIGSGKMSSQSYLMLKAQCHLLSDVILSPAERCEVCRICGKGVVFYNIAQYDLLYHKSLRN